MKTFQSLSTILGILLVIVLLFFLGAFAGYMIAKYSIDPIVIQGETKTEYKVIKIPVSQDDLLLASQSPIEITGNMKYVWSEPSFISKPRENWFDVKATDGYKESSKSFKLSSSSDGKWNYAIYAGIAGAGALAGIGLYSLLK